MNYDMTEQGFVLHLDATVYARLAVMKAFYHLQDRYIISYERRDKTLDVYFDYLDREYEALPDQIRSIMAELSFEMIRYDTVKETSALRELLVGRALYATCVDMSREESDDASPQPSMENSWLEDKDRIFYSWTKDA